MVAKLRGARQRDSSRSIRRCSRPNSSLGRRGRGWPGARGGRGGSDGSSTRVGGLIKLFRVTNSNTSATRHIVLAVARMGDVAPGLILAPGIAAVPVLRSTPQPLWWQWLPIARMIQDIAPVATWLHRDPASYRRPAAWMSVGWCWSAGRFIAQTARWTIGGRRWTTARNLSSSPESSRLTHSVTPSRLRGHYISLTRQ